MDLKTALLLTSGLSAFCIAYFNGSIAYAIVLPAVAVSLIVSVPALSPNGFGFFGFFMLVLLSSSIYGLPALIGTLVGFQLRKFSNFLKNGIARIVLNVGIALVIVGLVLFIKHPHEAKVTEPFDLEKAAISFAHRQPKVITETGPIYRSSVISRGYDGAPFLLLYVEGEKGKANVRVRIYDTSTSNRFSVEYVELPREARP